MSWCGVTSRARPAWLADCGRFRAARGSTCSVVGLGQQNEGVCVEMPSRAACSAEWQGGEYRVGARGLGQGGARQTGSVAKTCLVGRQGGSCVDCADTVTAVMADRRTGAARCGLSGLSELRPGVRPGVCDPERSLRAVAWLGQQPFSVTNVVCVCVCVVCVCGMCVCVCLRR